MSDTEALLAAWRAQRRHRQGEGPPPTAAQLALLAEPGAQIRIDAAWRRGWKGDAQNRSGASLKSPPARPRVQ